MKRYLTLPDFYLLLTKRKGFLSRLAKGYVA